MKILAPLDNTLCITYIASDGHKALGPTGADVQCELCSGVEHEGASWAVATSVG